MSFYQFSFNEFHVGFVSPHNRLSFTDHFHVASQGSWILRFCVCCFRSALAGSSLLSLIAHIHALLRETCMLSPFILYRTRDVSLIAYTLPLRVNIPHIVATSFSLWLTQQSSLQFTKDPLPYRLSQMSLAQAFRRMRTRHVKSSYRQYSMSALRSLQASVLRSNPLIYTLRRKPFRRISPSCFRTHSLTTSPNNFTR